MYDNVKGRTATASLELAATTKQKFDEFLRRQLGIGDANDPKTVVQALRKLYPTEATRLDDEGQGLPIRSLAPAEQAMAAPVMASESPGQRRLRQVQEALEADLELVMNHPSNRGYKAPLSGWRDAVLAELREGVDASYRAVDPVARDRTFYSVHKLGDYAWVARLVGARNPMVRVEFRRLAATMDMAAIILRVLAGEALFRAGFDEGGSVFQVPAQDLRQRKEGLIAALERFSSGSEESDPWADGPASYDRLLERLGDHGSPELRSIVRPEGMARLLSVLLNNIQQQQADSLRGLASAVPIELMQLRRLRDAAASLLSGQGGSPPNGEASSAPLAALVRALELFINAFDKPSAGSRLLRLVLPSPLESLQLAGTNGGGGTIRTLFEERAQLQAALDMLNADPDFDPVDWPATIKLDRALRDIDRAIDLYLLDASELDQSEVEQRSWLYGWMLRKWVRDGGFDGQGDDWTGDAPRNVPRDELRAHLNRVVDVLAPGEDEPDAAVARVFLSEQYALDRSSFQLAESLTQGSKDWEETVGGEVLGEYTTFPGVTGTLPRYRVPPPTRGSLDVLARSHAAFAEDFSQLRRGARQQDGQVVPPAPGQPGAGGPPPLRDQIQQLLSRVRRV